MDIGKSWPARLGQETPGGRKMSDTNEARLGVVHRAKDSSRLTVMLFSFFVVSGGLYIFYAKQHSFSPVYVTFGPVAIMLLFAATMLVAPRIHLRDDQAGDNLYYMGFIFTLISLGTALYQFNISAAHEKSAIVQNFGIAIASTICGITLRIIFAGMRQDPVEVERQARLELAEAARLIKIELDNTTMEFSAFSRTMKQIIEDRFNDMEAMHKEMSAKVSSACEQFFISLDETSKRSAERIEETAGHAADAITNLTKEIGAPIDEASQHMKETLKSTSSSMSSSLSSISRNIGHHGDKIVQNSEAISDALDGEIKKIVNQLEVMNKKFEQVGTPDKAINLSLSPVVDALIERVNRFENVSNSRIDQTTSSFERAIDTQGKEIERALDGLQVSVTQMAISFEKVSGQLSEIAAGLKERPRSTQEHGIEYDRPEARVFAERLISQPEAQERPRKWFGL
jgi:hypothetical protein